MKLERKVKLLVVDDQPEYFSQLSEYVDMCSHQYQFECRFADSRKSVGELLQHWHPTIVVLDAHACSVPCFELLEQLRLESIPVIVTSSSPSREIERTMLQRGATAYLPKTDDPDDLELVVNSLARFAEPADEVN